LAATSAALCAAAESALLSGDGERAAGLLAEALELADDAAARVDVLCLRARVAVLAGDGPATLASVRAEAGRLTDTDAHGRVLAARLLLDAAILALYCRDPDTLQTAQRAHELAQATDPLIRARAATILGIAYNYTGQPALGRRYLQRSAEVIRLGGSPQEVVHLLQQVVVGLAGLENYTDALALCRQYTVAVRGVGASGLLPLVLCLLANTAYFTADFDVMEMAGTEALGLARSQGQQPLQLYARVCLGLVLAVRGEADAAREHVGKALELIDATGVHTFSSTAYLGLGLVELGAGSWQAAAEFLAQVRAELDDLPTVSGTLHWRGDEIEALWRSGEHAAARAAHAAMLDGIDREGPWEHAAAARVGALLADDDAAAEALFVEAMSFHARSTSAFERARTQLCWGEWLLARGRTVTAAEHLTQARDAFAGVGAKPWLARATALLAAAEVHDSPAHAPEPPADAETGADAGTGTAPGTATLRAFGPLTLVRDGVETRIATDTPGRMLHLLVAAGGSVHVEQLAEALWPDTPPPRGSTRLRTVMSRARTRYGPLVRRDGAVVMLAEHVTVDVHRFTELARDALAHRREASAVRLAREAVQLYTGELLASDRYSEWAAAARERARLRYVGLLELLVDDAVQRDDVATAVKYARDCVDADPLDEAGYVRLGRLLLDAGRVSQAREAVDRAMAATTELGLPPSAALVALDRRARSAAS
jgi:DNA-binding SARP family transcriptional activator